MTFTTDSRGEIFIDNLRIGEYVVTELENEASADIKLLIRYRNAGGG